MTHTDWMVVSVGTEPASREVDAAAWDSLLAFLAGGRGDRGAAYEEIRRRLQFFFEWKGCAGAPELADETLNRVAVKLATGEQIATSEPHRYVLGVARLVSLEAYRRMAKQTSDDGAAHAALDDSGDRADREARLAALESCLETLPPRARDLLLRYHGDDGGQRVDHRKQIADEWRLSANALRIRVHRLRAEIERCVLSRLEVRGGGAP